jgi:hypothetical protein
VLYCSRQDAPNRCEYLVGEYELRNHVPCLGKQDIILLTKARDFTFRVVDAFLVP